MLEIRGVIKDYCLHAPEVDEYADSDHNRNLCFLSVFAGLNAWVFDNQAFGQPSVDTCSYNKLSIDLAFVSNPL